MGWAIKSLRKTVLVEETGISLQYIQSEPVLFSNQLFLAAIEVALHSQKLAEQLHHWPTTNMGIGIIAMMNTEQYQWLPCGV